MMGRAECTAGNTQEKARLQHTVLVGVCMCAHHTYLGSTVSPWLKPARRPATACPTIVATAVVRCWGWTQGGTGCSSKGTGQQRSWTACQCAHLLHVVAPGRLECNRLQLLLLLLWSSGMLLLLPTSNTVRATANQSQASWLIIYVCNPSL